MNAALDFEWPKALRAVRRAAEDGTLGPRSLYPMEVKALCDLVAGVPLNETPRDIAPGMTAFVRRQKKRDALDEHRTAYYFTTRFCDGRMWQCALFTVWDWKHDAKVHALRPKNIVQALTCSIAPEGQR